MKTLKLLSILLLFPLVFHAQRSLTGLWTGSLINEDSTIRKDLSFEIALTQYKEKVYGYSRRTFIVNDTLYYVLKRVKGKVNGNVCDVVDEEYISYNFPGQVDKGVKVTYHFTLNEQDSSWSLNGKWETNKVRKGFYSIHGTVSLQEEKNFDNSKIFPHLEELKMADDVAFYKESKQPAPIIAATKTGAIKPTAKEKEKTKEPEVIAKKEKPVKKKEEPAVVKPTEPVAKIETVKTATPAPKEPVKEVVKVAPPKKEETVAPVVNPATVQPVATAKPNVTAAAAFVAERKIAAPQIVSFTSDSLELSLYDNGEVDGDTVSVLLNNEIILAKQGLKASAIKKTIYIQPGTSEINMVLYAENLGKYPPNTGLLVVHDGEEVYQIRFSADLTQNAAIIFKRKGK